MVAASVAAGSVVAVFMARILAAGTAFRTAAGLTVGRVADGDGTRRTMITVMATPITAPTVTTDTASLIRRSIGTARTRPAISRSEEHTSELQSHFELIWR